MGILLRGWVVEVVSAGIPVKKKKAIEREQERGQAGKTDRGWREGTKMESGRNTKSRQKA